MAFFFAPSQPRGLSKHVAHVYKHMPASLCSSACAAVAATVDAPASAAHHTPCPSHPRFSKQRRRKSYSRPPPCAGHEFLAITHKHTRAPSAQHTQEHPVIFAYPEHHAVYCSLILHHLPCPNTNKQPPGRVTRGKSTIFSIPVLLLW